MSLFNEASLVVTPNGYKADKLYSIKPTSGAGDLDVVRATGATRVNESGLIETVAANVPRLDYTNGSCPSILVEEQRTNILLNSVFNGAVSGTPGTPPTNWLYMQNTGELTVIPFGLGNTLRFKATPSPGGTALAIQQQKPLDADSVYVYSFHINILISNRIDFFVHVSVPSGATVTYFYNGETVVPTVFHPPTGEGFIEVKIETTTNGTGTFRCGAGIQGASNCESEIREPQVEKGDTASSYIPTEAAAVTRNADVISITGLTGITTITETFENETTNVISGSPTSYTMSQGRIKQVIGI